MSFGLVRPPIGLPSRSDEDARAGNRPELLPDPLRPGKTLAPLLLTTDAVGGVWRYSIDLATGLVHAGATCVLAVLGPAPTPHQRREAEAIPGLRLVHTGLPLDWTATGPAHLAATAHRLAALAALLGATRILLHAPALLNGAAFPAPVAVVAHSCVGTWWHAMRTTPPPPEFQWRNQATATGLRRAQAIIAPSHAHAQALRAVYGPLAIEVVHNGHTPPDYIARPDVIAPPDVVAHPDVIVPRARAILAAGRLWDEAKGIAAIDAAAARTSAPIHAAGPLQGPNGAAIQLRHARTLGPLDATAMAQACATHQVFVSMARYEPFGLSVLEAAAAGMQLVLSDIPTFRELWDGVARFVATPDALPQALEAALADPHDTSAQTRAARYPIARTVARTLEILQTCGTSRAEAAA